MVDKTDGQFDAVVVGSSAPAAAWAAYVLDHRRRPAC